jgi:hypothetical protein
MSDMPQDLPPLEHPSHIDESRRRRRRKLLIPVGKTERALYVGEIAKRLVPGVEFFIFSLFAGLVITLAILLDSPAIFILGALLAPFMIPVVGLGFSAAVGSLSFFLRSVGGLLIGSAFVFASGALGGWLSKLFADLHLTQARNFTVFSIPDFLLLTIGAVLAIYLTVRVPKQRSLVASVPLAYEIYIPIAVAGFGLTGGIEGFFPQGLKIAAVYIAWVILIGTIMLAIMKLRPFTFFGYLLTAVILGGALYTLVVSSALGSALQKQMTVFITRTPEPPIVANTEFNTPTPTITLPTFDYSSNTAETPFITNTLPPTNTPTASITPKPTPVWAKVYSPEFNGIYVRATPGNYEDYITTLPNDQPVQVLTDVRKINGAYWVNILLDDGTEGWVLRNLLQTATPAPDW